MAIKLFELLDIICKGVVDGELPYQGVDIDGINHSSYMGYLCRWDKTKPIALCTMRDFYHYYNEKQNE